MQHEPTSSEVAPSVKKVERWQDVKSGLVAELKICCPECMEECVIEFDSQELDGATEVRMPCDGCGLTLSAYLAATVQQQGQLSLLPGGQP